MKSVAIIPSRYNSSRLIGKPLMDICGRPMVWWVYNQVKNSKMLDEIYVATDKEEIRDVCNQYNIPCIMTSEYHPTSTERIYEAAKCIKADVYVCVNGDEPLIDSKIIEEIIPKSLDSFFASNLVAKINNPVEVIDETNIKIVTDENNYALFMSRSPIPHPKASVKFDYYKHLGVLAYSMDALEFFVNTPKGAIEKIEDINELRFIEHGKKLKMIPVESETLSVDTLKDLEFVREIVRKRIEKGEIAI